MSQQEALQAPGGTGASAPDLVFELAGSGDFVAVDRLITEAYTHDYGPSDRSDRDGLFISGEKVLDLFSYRLAV